MEACAECDLETEYTLLDELKVVNGIRVDVVTEKASTNQPSGRSTVRVICTLWCSALHPMGDLSQPSCKTNQGSRPDIAHTMQAVRQKVIEKHSGAACAEAAAAARLAADGPRTRPPSNALSAMMAARNAQRAYDRVEAALVAAKERAAVARQVLVAADREVTVLTAEAEAADAELPAKRQCTRAPLKAWETATQGWSAEQWSAFEAAEQKRRAKPIVNDKERVTAQTKLNERSICDRPFAPQKMSPKLPKIALFFPLCGGLTSSLGHPKKGLNHIPLAHPDRGSSRPWQI